MPSECVVEPKKPYRVQKATPGFLQAFGHEESHVVGRSLLMLHGPSTDGKGVVEIIERAAAGATPERSLAAFYASDGSPQLMSVEARARDDGTCLLKMQPSDAVTQKEAFVDDGACKMVLSVGTWKVEDITMAFTEQFGFTGKTARGRTARIVQGPGTDVQQLSAMMEAAVGGLVQSSILLTYSSDCTELRTMVRVIPVHGGNGRVTHLVLAFVLEQKSMCRPIKVAAPGVLRRTQSSAQRVSALGVIGTWEGLPHALVQAILLCLVLPTFMRMGGPIIAAGHAGIGAGVASLPLKSSEGASRLFETHNGMNQYKGHAPPIGLRNQHADAHVGLNSQHDSNRITLMLDLDKTVLFGNDGNDLGVALQWMDKDNSKVEQLYRLLINPNLRDMYNSYVQRGKEVDVVVYTRRPQIVYYKSCVRENTVPVRYADNWHGQGQLYFPSSVKCSDDIFDTYAGPELVEDEVHDVKKSLDRLLAARNAIMHELGLTTAPPVVVTAQAKSIDATARHFGVPVDSCLLFDDNVDLRHDPRVVIVEPLVSLPPQRRADLLAFMEQELPAKSLEEDLVEYLEEARPDEMSIERTAEGKVAWWVPEGRAPQTPWPAPETVARSKPRQAHDTLPRKLGALGLESSKEAEPFSNVSPADMPLRGAQGNAQLIDLCAAAEKAALMRSRDYEEQLAGR